MSFRARERSERAWIVVRAERARRFRVSSGASERARVRKGESWSIGQEMRVEQADEDLMR
jgi:hypothetical protein